MTFGSGGGFTNIQKYALTYAATGAPATYVSYTCPTNTIARVKLQYIRGTVASSSSIGIRTNFGAGAAATIPVISSVSSGGQYLKIDTQGIYDQLGANPGSATFPASTTPSTLFSSGHLDPWAQELILTQGEQIVATVFITGGNSVVFEFTAMEQTV